MSRVTAPHISDVQGSPDARSLPIDKVGIKGLRHPVAILGRDGRVQHTVGAFDMYVNLAHDVRGTHMSRFVEILNGHKHPLSFGHVKSLLAEIGTILGADDVYLEIRLPFFINKRAPVSGVASLLDYDITLRGEKRGAEIAISVQVLVPVTSLCPCSKEISNYGAHNQRSHVTLTARIDDGIWIEDLVDIIEAEASCQIYGLIKRPDEKFITERAYDNPKFVEDMVRDVAARLNDDPRILAYSVESENFESIHNHSAYARIHGGKHTHE